MVTVAIPEGLDWEVWRLVAAGYGTLEEIETRWSMLDVWSAHAALDLRESLEIKARATR